MAKAAAPKLPTRTDRRVGERIRLFRKAQGISRQKLADAIGICHQQLHKHEVGMNRVSAGRLHQIAEVLGVPVAYFVSSGSERAGGSEDIDLLEVPGAPELIRLFNSLPDERSRSDILALVLSIARRHGAGTQQDED